MEQSYPFPFLHQTNDSHDLTRLAGKQWLNHGETGWKTQYRHLFLKDGENAPHFFF